MGNASISFGCRTLSSAVFVLGHVATIGESGVFHDLDLLAGEEVLTLMLPDLLACHDWAYDRAWGWSGCSVTADLVCAHMLGDALIHHGPRWTPQRRKVGWVYRRMGLISRAYEAFFDHAEGLGWRNPALARDSRRGWAHTMVEYSIDQWLADTGVFEEVQEAATSAAQATLENRTWVDRVVDDLAVDPSKPIATQPSRYCGALARAVRPDEMHLRGLAVKFGLDERDEVLDWIRSQLRAIVLEVGDDELRAIRRQLSEVIVEPGRLNYPVTGTGRWAGTVLAKS